ncbi:MAG: hypothetical protein WDW19_05845 [Neisseriaceae bacterium]
MVQLFDANVFELNWEIEVSKRFNSSTLQAVSADDTLCITTEEECMKIFLPK